MQDLPNGVVTFLFTDVEGSTRLWQENPDVMMEALRQHDDAIEGAVGAHDGALVKPRGEGDSTFNVFRSAVSAVAASAEIQRRLSTVEWVSPKPLRVRASLHTGMADLQLGDYYGSTVNRAARLRAIAHGGQTVISGSTWELVQDELPDGVTVTDMGRHRLKDLTRPEHVFQINIAGLENKFPPLVSLDAVPNNLPEQLTEFIGRQSELAEAVRLLGQTRLLTILAAGGAGKTRVAIQAAADVISDYEDGVFFIGLADIRESSDIVQTVAESLGLGLSTNQDPQAQLLTYLANKNQLLVFDNFEHVSDGAPIVSEILKAAPQVTAIITTRTKLNLTGESVLALGGLDTTWDSPEEASQTSGVRLFLDAARRSNPTVELRPEDIEPMAEILRLTDGMPLGILLAAAWADMLSIGDIASEIAKNVDFLETEAVDAPDRHRSIRAVFDYTWALLTPGEQAIFAALSVFRGGFTRDAAKAVSGASLRDLAALANKSLVTANPDTGRYRVHELLRQFAEAELEADTQHCDEVLEAHAGYYGGLASEAFALIHEGDQRLMLEIIEGDIDNIRGAWRRALESGNAHLTRQILVALWIIYEVRGWHQAAVPLLGEAIDTLDADSQNHEVLATHALSMATRGWFLALVGREDEGARDASDAIETLRSTSDIEALWLAFHCRCLCTAYQLDFDKLYSLASEGLVVAKSLDGRFAEASITNWRTLSAQMIKTREEAKEILEESDVYKDRGGGQYIMSWHHMQQGRLALVEGRLKDAVELYQRSVGFAAEIGYARVVHVSTEGLGDANSAAKDLDAAEAAYIKALASAEQMSMVREMLSVIVKIAKTRAEKGDQSKAVELLVAVLNENISRQQVLMQDAPTIEIAEETIAGLKQLMEPDEYEKARAAGTSRSYGEVVRELTSPSRNPSLSL